MALIFNCKVCKGITVLWLLWTALHILVKKVEHKLKTVTSENNNFCNKEWCKKSFSIATHCHLQWNYNILMCRTSVVNLVSVRLPVSLTAAVQTEIHQMKLFLAGRCNGVESSSRWTVHRLYEKQYSTVLSFLLGDELNFQSVHNLGPPAQLFIARRWGSEWISVMTTLPVFFPNWEADS